MVGIAWERDRVARVVETAAVLALCALAVGGNVADVEGLWRRVLAVALGAAMTVPLLARRRAPFAVLTAVVGAAWLQFALLGPSVGALGSWMAYLVATYSVGAHHGTRWAVVGLGVSTVPAAVFAAVQLRAGDDASEIVQPVMVLIAAWVAGRISARRHHRAELVEHRAAQVESGAADIAREAAERERTRIARELHDVVTHSMSVMVVQAQAAQTLAASDTDRAREAMRAVEDAGRTALVEMRRLLGVSGLMGRWVPRGTGLRSPGWTTCPAWCNACERPACRCRMRLTAIQTGCPPVWRCAPIGSCRRRCRTWSGIAGPLPRG